MNLITYFKDGVNRYYITMPTLYNDINTDDLNEMNNAIKEGKPPSIVYYGKDGNRNDIVIHEFGEGMFHLFRQIFYTSLICVRILLFFD